MDLKIQHIQKEIHEIKLGDMFCVLEGNPHCYIVMKDNKTKFYYLKDLDGLGAFCQYGEHNTLESLRQSIMKISQIKLIHYPAKEYRLELVKK